MKNNFPINLDFATTNMMRNHPKHQSQIEENGFIQFPLSNEVNEEPAWKLTQKVALMHNSVKNNECDVTYILK
jgi:hypothetical protein